MNIMGIYTNHDSSIAIKVGNVYRIYEFERLTKMRYYSLNNGGLYKKELYLILKSIINKEFGQIKFDKCYFIQNSLKDIDKNILQEIFEINEFIVTEHHISHASCAYYQSPYNEALILSYDGGGEDFNGTSFTKIFYANKNNIFEIYKSNLNFGEKYRTLSFPIKEIIKRNDHYAISLNYSGKFMGIAGYGKPDLNQLDNFKKYYEGDDIINFNSSIIKPSTQYDIFEKNESYIFAATGQLAFEEEILSIIMPFIEKYKIPICLTGGCALNVLFNERLRKLINYPIFIPPNPNDCGLSLGALLFHNPEKNVNITYNGFPILDIDKLPEYVNQFNAEKIDCSEIAKLLSHGKIIGIMYGNSECGPRSLGNRSIICDPSIENMKNILNQKVKFREWFRPFAPFVKLENVNKYFDFDKESLYMSFAPNVKNEYIDKLKAITHVDNTARVQTVTSESHRIFYNLLTEFEKITNIGVLLNTSFNIKGKPILTTIEDALEVLNTTELDYVVIENYLFSKEINK